MKLLMFTCICKKSPGDAISKMRWNNVSPCHRIGGSKRRLQLQGAFDSSPREHVLTSDIVLSCRLRLYCRGIVSIAVLASRLPFSCTHSSLVRSSISSWFCLLFRSSLSSHLPRTGLKMTETTFISGADGNEVFQAKYIPKQKAPVAADHPSMKAYISTFPALGQVTQIDKNTTVFTALLEVDESRASDPWQVSLWHSEGKEWREVPMEPVKNATSRPSVLQKPSNHFGSALKQLYFTTPLAIHLPTSFTIKFRGNSDQSWKWVRDHQGTQDGIVMWKSITNQDAISSDLGDYVEGLNPDLKFKNYRSQSPGTTLWSVEASIEAADGEKSTIKDIKFGLPWGSGRFSR